MTFLIFFLVALFFSALFSGYEIAYFTVERGKIGLWFRGALGRFVRSHPAEVLTTILVGNTLANVGASIALTHFFLRIPLSPRDAVGVAGFSTTLSLLLLGEILPKAFSKVYADFVVRNLSVFLYVVYRLTSPVVDFLGRVVSLFWGLREEGKWQRGREDLERVILRGRADGLLREGEGRILRTALYFHELKADEIMMVREDLPFADLDAENPLKEVRNQSPDFILVTRGSLDNTLGIIPSKDLFLKEEVLDLEAFLRPVAFVYRDWPLNRVLGEMEKKRTGVAVVLDEYGGTVGALTLDDLLEKLLGYPRKGEIPAGWEMFPSGLVLKGRVRLRDLEERKIFLPAGKSETLAGLVMAHLGRIPKTGERISLGSYGVEILEASPREVKTLLLRKHGTA